VLLVVSFALFIDYMMYGLVVPLTPYSSAKIVGEQQMGTLYGGYAVGVLLATPLFGHLGDKYGCRLPMVIGVCLIAIATSLFAFGDSFYALLLARVLQGASAAASWTAGFALVAERYHDKRVQMMGLAMVGSTAGSIVGPVLGTWCFELGGYLLPFQIAGCLVALDFCMRVFLLPNHPATAETKTDLKALLLDKTVLAAAFAVALAASAWGLIEPLLPVHLTNKLHGTPHEIGPMFTISTIAYGLMAPVVNYVAEKFSIKKAICFGMVMMAISLPLLAVFPSTLATGAMLCLISMSYAFVLNPTSAELGNAVDRRGMNCYSAVYAVYNIAYSIGMMSSDVFAAVLSERLGLLQSLGIMSAVLVLGIPVVLKGVSGDAVAELKQTSL
jgi:multidrug resistance protein